MRHGSLESGIGMFDYAAEMMGWENVFHCEISPFCRTILNYYWPKAKSYANVFGFNGYEWRGKVDIITAGFPCQPFSNAGKRKGSEDDRHIWPENMRIFREAQPTFIVCENVPGIITIEDGMVFEQVCSDLENEGYEVQTFIIPAVATDKDHRRDRLWIVAYSKCNHDFTKERRRNEEKASNEKQFRPEYSSPRQFSGTNTQLYQDRQSNGYEITPNTNNKRLEGGQEAGNISSSRTKCNKQFGGQNEKRESWIKAATRLCTVDDGSAGKLDTTAISKSKWRTESLKTAGNTIVWEIAFEIFKAIEETIKRI